MKVERQHEDKKLGEAEIEMKEEVTRMNKQELTDKMNAALKGRPWDCPEKKEHVDRGGEICPKCRAAIPTVYGPLEWANFFGPPIPEELLDDEADIRSEQEADRLKYEAEMTKMHAANTEAAEARYTGDQRKFRAALERGEEHRVAGYRVLLRMSEYHGKRLLQRRLGVPELKSPPAWIERAFPNQP
jgi:hypothetical protein